MATINETSLLSKMLREKQCSESVLSTFMARLRVAAVLESNDARFVSLGCDRSRVLHVDERTKNYAHSAATNGRTLRVLVRERSKRNSLSAVK
jgi:hypothetical protein